MKRPPLWVLALLVLVLSAWQCPSITIQVGTPTETPAPTFTPTPTAIPTATPTKTPTPTARVVACEEYVTVQDQSGDADLDLANLVESMEFLGLCGREIEVTLIDGDEVGAETLAGEEAGGLATSHCVGDEFRSAEIILAVGIAANNTYQTYRGEEVSFQEGWGATLGMLHELYHVYQAVSGGCGDEAGIAAEHDADDWALANYQRFGVIVPYEESAPPPRPSPTPLVAPLQITLRDIHYEAETAQGGRYFHTDWWIYNQSDQTVYRVWRPFFVYNNGEEWWAGYYDCQSGWPPGNCYESLTAEEPNIGPGETVTFVWYAITETPDEWVQYAYLQVLGWEFVIEFDPAGNIVRQDAYPISGTPETPPGDND